MVRAQALERTLGTGEIYLKLEGNNPSGHREDRMAYLIIRDCQARGKDTVCMATFGTVGGSLAYLAGHYHINCVFYVPDKTKISRKKLLDLQRVKIIEYGSTYEECVRESRRVAVQNGWYNANPGLENNFMNMYAFSYIAREIIEYASGTVERVFCQTNNGSSVAGLHLGFRQMWTGEKIDYIPRLVAVTAPGNPITVAFEQGLREIPTTTGKVGRDTHLRKMRTAFNGQDALNAIYDSDGLCLAPDQPSLQEAATLLRKLERIKIGLYDSYPVAALVTLARAGSLGPKANVLVLNDARVDMDIERVDRANLPSGLDHFIQTLDRWLGPFTDPPTEILEAVNNALDQGHVLLAYYKRELVGIAVISRMNFDIFFPAFHLSYIVTKPDVKGRGIATQLMEYALALTGGQLSLHVETKNERAIKLYEKMGFKRKYFRMIYQDVSEGTP